MGIGGCEGGGADGALHSSVTCGGDGKGEKRSRKRLGNRDRNQGIGLFIAHQRFVLSFSLSSIVIFIDKYLFGDSVI